MLILMIISKHLYTSMHIPLSKFTTINVVTFHMLKIARRLMCVCGAKMGQYRWEINTSTFLFIVKWRMGVHEWGSFYWIRMTVTDFEKNDGKKEEGALILQLPSKCLLSQGCRIKLSPIKRKKRQKKGKVWGEVKQWWKRGFGLPKPLLTRK